MKPGAPPLRATKLLDQLRERCRYLHYSLKTEKAYLYWVRFYIRWSAAQVGHMRHPRELTAKDVEAFLTMLATERKVSASTHNQALSALLFLYREVLSVDLPWLDGLQRPQQARRIPSVLTQQEVATLLAHLDGTPNLLARLLYGTGMRLMEGMRLRIKDVDFDRHVVIVRDAKGGKDRVVMMPRSLAFEERLQRALKKALPLAGLHKPVSVHTLRHSFATHVLKVAAGGTASPLDALRASPPVLREPQPAYA